VERQADPAGSGKGRLARHPRLAGSALRSVNVETISRADAKRGGLKYYFTGEPCVCGHVSKRFVKNFTCVRCDRGGRFRRDDLLPKCCICGDRVRSPGHRTCSPECKSLWSGAKARAERDLRLRKICPGCDMFHYTPYRRYCSDECLKRHLYPAVKEVTNHCIICRVAFTTSRCNQITCSGECRKQRDKQLHTEGQRRKVERGYVAEYGRQLRAKVAAAVTIARKLEIFPPRGNKYHHNTKGKRRAEREKYAVMIAFRRKELLPTGETTT
jgi:hypothetical protein